MNENTIIFTIARMNPPTPGHLLLIQSLIEEGIKKNVETVYVILSKTKDNDENPIQCEKKIELLGENKDALESMVNKLKETMKAENRDEEIITKINNINVVCLCVPEIPRATPFTAIGQLIANKIDKIDKVEPIHLFLIIGQDRKEMIASVEKVFTNKNISSNVESVDGKILDRPNMEEYKNLSRQELASKNISDIPLGAFSASFVRKLVKYGLKDKFHDVYSPYLDKLKIDTLYDSIYHATNTKKNASPDTLPSAKRRKDNSRRGGKKKTRKYRKKSSSYKRRFS